MLSVLRPAEPGVQAAGATRRHLPLRWREWRLRADDIAPAAKRQIGMWNHTDIELRRPGHLEGVQRKCEIPGSSQGDRWLAPRMSPTPVKTTATPRGQSR